MAEPNVPSFLGGTVSRDSVGGCVSVVPIGPRVVRWYKAATGDGWIVTLSPPSTIVVPTILTLFVVFLAARRSIFVLKVSLLLVFVFLSA